MQKNINQKDQLENFKRAFSLDQKKIELLEKYVDLLLIGQKSLNLIANSTIKNLWIRHIIDSAQIYKHLYIKKHNELILDIGSGSGLPGIVLAIMGLKNIILCEKSKKKSIFLRKTLNSLEIEENIYVGKVESLFSNNIKYIIARAFKPLTVLLMKTNHLVNRETILILHKGKNYKEEIINAKKIFNFSCSYYDSITSKDGKILKIERIRKING